MTSIALVTRELFPFDGGGIGVYVPALAEVLSEVADVTLITSERHRRPYEELRRAGSALLPPARVRFEFVAEPAPDELGGWYGPFHAWSGRVYRSLVALFPDGGPDLVEFPDYLGEGAVTAQARHTLDTGLRRSRVAVRIHTTAEIVSVLNGSVSAALESRATFELERIALKYADYLVWPGGDVLNTYRRFYGDEQLAFDTRIRLPVILGRDHEVSDEAPFLGSDTSALKILYVGRLERRKGVHNLVRALQRIPPSDWRLALVGDDTLTAPLGASMREHLELQAEGDPRISFLGPRSRDAVTAMIEKADVLVSPSLWECWPNTVLEALHQGCPVAATPVGGHLDMARPGTSGWLFESTSPEATGDLFERLITERDELAAVRAASGPRQTFAELADPERIRQDYLAIARRAPHRPRGRRTRLVTPANGTPLVSIIIPYFELDETVAQSVESAVSQTWERVEVIVVNDGSTRECDWVLAELAATHPIVVLTQINSGLGAARNFGIRQSRGRYVVPLDADNVLAPEFIERGVTVLEDNPDLAFVTSWLQYIDAAGTTLIGGEYRPLWNRTELLDAQNLAGDAVAVIRKGVFDQGFWYDPDITSYEDWLFYRDLRDAGLEGAVIPTPLVRYRVRDESMVRSIGHHHHDRLLEEMNAHGRYRAIKWTSSSD